MTFRRWPCLLFGLLLLASLSFGATSRILEDEGIINPLIVVPSCVPNDSCLNGALTYILNTTGTAPKTLLITPGSWNLSNNVTIPSNVSLLIARGAILNVASGKALIINGGMQTPGVVQIFSGSGAVVFGAGGVADVFPDWWGTGSSALQSAIDGATNGGQYAGTVRLAMSRNYSLTATAQLRKFLTLEGNGATISFSGTGVALNSDPGTAAVARRFLTIRNLKLRSTSASATTGILLYDNADVVLDNVYIDGRPAGASGDGSDQASVGNTIAGLRMTCSTPNGAAITTYVSHSFFLSNAGAGVKIDNCVNANQLTFVQNRIQGNVGVGFHMPSAASRAIYVAGNDIEGSGVSAIVVDKSEGSLVFVGNYLEQAFCAPLAKFGTQASIRGLLFQGNYLKCYGGTGTKILELGDPGVPVLGAEVTGNTFESAETGIFLKDGSDLKLWPNTYSSVTAAFATEATVGNRISPFQPGYGSLANASTIQSGASEGAMYNLSVPAGWLRLGGVRLHATGSYLNTSGSARQATIRLKYGGTIGCEWNIPSLTSDANPRGLQADLTMVVNGDDITQQRVYGTVSISSPQPNITQGGGATVVDCRNPGQTLGNPLAVLPVIIAGLSDGSGTTMQLFDIRVDWISN